MSAAGSESLVQLSNLAITLAANLLAQTTLLIAGGFFAARFLRANGAALQSAILRMTLAAVLLCPGASLGLSAMGVRGLVFYWPRATLRQTEVPAPSMVSGVDSPGTIVFSARSNPDMEPSPRVLADLSNPASAVRSDQASDAPVSANRQRGATSLDAGIILPITLTTIWLLVSAFLLIRLLLAHVWMARVRRLAQKAPAMVATACEALARGLCVKPPVLLTSPIVRSPCLIGFVRPAILLPESHNSGDAVAWREVLVHEMAHLARRDCLWNLLGRLARAAIFFQPLLWKLTRRIEEVSDDVADDYVVRHGSDRGTYAHQLVVIAERYQPAPSEAAAGMGVISLRSSLGRRVQRILDARRRLSVGIGGRTAGAVILLGLCATLTAALVGAAGKNTDKSSAQPTTTKGVAIENPRADSLVPIRSEGSSPERPAFPVILTAAQKGDDVSAYRFEIARDVSCRVYFGWFADGRDSDGRFAGIATPKPGSEPIEVELTIRKAADYFVLIQEYREGKSAKQIRTEERFDLAKNCRLTDSFLGEPLILTNARYQTLWVGNVYEQLKNGSRGLHAIRLVTRVLKEGEDAASLRPPFDPLPIPSTHYPFTAVGKVTDEQGRPMYGATVRAAAGMGTLLGGGETVTGADGRYVLRIGPGYLRSLKETKLGVGFQVAVIRAEKSGFYEQNLSRQGDLYMAESLEFVPKQHETTRPVILPKQPYEVNFVLCPAAVVKGRLLDEKGDPVAKQSIYMDAAEHPPASSVFAGSETDADGRFAFDDLPPSMPLWLTLRHTKGVDRTKHLHGIDLETSRFQFDRPGVYEMTVVYDATSPALLVKTPVAARSSETAGDRPQASRSSPTETQTAPVKTSYAWQRTDTYIPPDYKGFFPEDQQAAGQLEALWRSEDKDRRPDSEILSTVRRGFRAYQGDKGDIVRWIGNRCIWNKQPQNPEAIEIMYHVTDIGEDYGTGYYGVYFGLSVVQPKTPAILRRLADMAMASDNPNLLHRIAWGCTSQKDELLVYLQPSVKSGDETVREKADVLGRIVRGELKAFEWAGERSRAKKWAALQERMPEDARLSFAELNDRYSSLAAELKVDAARYRASTPVFEKFAEVARNYVAPWGLQGEKARLQLVEAVEKNPNVGKTMKYDRKAIEKEIGKIIGPLFKDIAAEVQKLPIYESCRRDLDQQGTINLNGALYVVREYGDQSKIQKQFPNPFPEGTLEYVQFEREVGEALFLVCGPFAKILAKYPPALEEKQQKANALYELMENHPSRGDVRLAPKYVDEYVDSLEKEYQKIAEYTERYWEVRKQKEAADKQRGEAARR